MTLPHDPHRPREAGSRLLPPRLATSPLRVALMGFTGPELSALTALLEQAHHRNPAYLRTDSPEEAQFIIANSDRSGVIDLLVAAQRVGDTVLVGHHARQGTAGWLERPVDPLHMLRVLDDAAERRALAQRSAAKRTSFASQANPVGASTTEWVAPWLGHPTPQPDWGLPLSPPTHRARLQAVPKRVPPRPDEPLLALLVEPDDEAAHGMRRLLQTHGIASERVRQAKQAYLQMADQVFDVILVDSALEESPPASRATTTARSVDGLVLAQTFKRMPRAFDDACPPVFVTTAQASASEQARAMLAGADAYLSKPVQAHALAQALDAVALRSSEAAPLSSEAVWMPRSA
jgi:two-component system, cell cycle response regulator